MMLLVQVLLRLRGSLATQPLAPLGEGMTVILLKRNYSYIYAGKFNSVFNAVQFYLYNSKSQQQAPQDALYCKVNPPQ